MAPVSPADERPKSNAELSPTQRRLRTCLTGGWCLVGLMGTLVGISPALNKLVLGAIGRENVSMDAMHAAPLQIAAILAVQLAAFLGIYWMLSRPTAPRYALPCVTLLYIAVVIGAWWPIRLEGVIYRDINKIVTYFPASTLTPHRATADESRTLWQGRDRDEARDLRVVRVLKGDGVRGLLGADVDLDRARRQHPPGAYFVMAAFPDHPIWLRGLSVALFLFGVVGIICWIARVQSLDCATAALLVFASAPGLVNDLAFRVSLDVFPFAIGATIPLLLYRRQTKVLGQNGAVDMTQSRVKLLSIGVLIAGMSMFKFTSSILAIALTCALYPSNGKRCLFLSVPSLVAVLLYHIALPCLGIAFEATYLGELFYSLIGERQRQFQGGGFLKSMVTLTVFVLSPLGFIVWVGGLSGSMFVMFRQMANRFECFWREIATCAYVAVVLVYIIHPLLRYLSPSLWAVVATIAHTFYAWRRGRMLTDGLLAAAASYGMMKLLLDSYL